MSKVFCYYNLHKHLWSVKALDGPQKGRVIAHSHKVFLTNAVGKVSEAGRQRVLKEQRKNVHAGIVGYLPDGDLLDTVDTKGRKLYYNPYKVDRFVYAESGESFEGAEVVYLDATDGKRDVIEVAA